MKPCAHSPESAHALFPARDYITGDDFVIHRCEACGLARTQPTPSPEAIGRYYPDAYYGDVIHRRFPAPVEWLQDRLYAHRARRLEGTIKGASRRVLDIGCGKGFLLRAFRHRGWVAQGVELSEHSARHAREILGLEVHVGALTDAALADKRFDAAVLWHVLEHSPDPARMLGEVHDLLDSGGLLLVSVPNFGSPEARFFTSGWFHLDVPRHLVHFSQETLLALLRESGFEPIERWRFAPEFDLFSFVQSALNGLGLPPNKLYRMLRGQSAKLPYHGERWWHGPLTLGLAFPLTLLGFLWIPLAGWLGLGSTLGLIVQKTGAIGGDSGHSEGQAGLDASNG